jgi:hypothetical protein
VSIEVLSAVWKRSTQEGKCLLVLLALADNADEDRWLAWPSVATLAKKARMSERSVQRALRSLEDAGEIVLVREGGRVDGKYRSAVYRVLPQGRQPVAPDSTTGVSGGASGVPTVSPEPSVEPSSPSPRKKKVLAADEEPTGFGEFLAFHGDLTGRSVPKLGTIRRSDFARAFARLQDAGHTAEDFELEVVGAHADEWRRERGFDRLETVLAVEKFGRYRDDGRRARQQAESVSPYDALEDR